METYTRLTPSCSARLVTYGAQSLGVGVAVHPSRRAVSLSLVLQPGMFSFQVMISGVCAGRTGAMARMDAQSKQTNRDLVTIVFTYGYPYFRKIGTAGGHRENTALLLQPERITFRG